MNLEEVRCRDTEFNRANAKVEKVSSWKQKKKDGKIC